MVDVALWDFAGKAYGVPIYQMLGGYKEKIPAYASTDHGHENGGLDSAEAFADFALQCRDLGYLAFKIHGWGNGPIKRGMQTLLETRKRVGDDMDLMIDPACEYDTWADALKVGRACDDARFFWLEDAYKDGGVSAFAHNKLRGLLKTPLLQTEHIFGLEQHVDFIVSGGTDFVRTGVYEDAGHHRVRLRAKRGPGSGQGSRRAFRSGQTDSRRAVERGTRQGVRASQAVKRENEHVKGPRRSGALVFLR